MRPQSGRALDWDQNLWKGCGFEHSERQSLILKGADLGQGKKWSSGMGQTWSEVVVHVLDSSGLRVGRAWWFLKEQPRPRKGAVKKMCFIKWLGLAVGRAR